VRPLPHREVRQTSLENDHKRHADAADHRSRNELSWSTYTYDMSYQVEFLVEDDVQVTERRKQSA